MPEITAVFIAFIAGSIAIGAVIGWVTRANRCAQEKTAVNEGWQRQLEAQRTEHARLLKQNRTLMEQISQLQASGKDAANRARELSEALKETFERRDQLQRELKETRSGFEQAVRQRDELQSVVRSSEERSESTRAALQEKDNKIFHLSRELENWQNRLPPLIERYRERDGEARKLEEDLASARARIDELEQDDDTGETRIEPVDQEQLGDELDASNDPTNASDTGLEEVLVEDNEAGTDEDLADITEASGSETARTAAASEATAGSVETLAAEVDHLDDLDDLDDVDELMEEAAGEPAMSLTTAAITELPERETGGLRDNLRLIKGIGPTIEKTLNELGIFRFHQIAEMSDYDIDRIARRLKGFSTRIYREDWIGQARDLQLKKAGT